MEKISVSIRVRPLNKLEVAKGSPWTVDAKSLHLCNERGQPIAGQAYTFDHVFDTGVRTQDIYHAVTEDIIQSTVHGFNGTVFAYGQTSSGKTHTMRGTPIEPGIIPQAIRDVFQTIEQAHDREFLLRVSYLEIYNEEINDLLNPENRKLPVHENLERGVFVAGLAEEIVVSPEHVLELMANGEAHRHIGETNMNQASSRSHTIFRMVIESREKLADDDSSIEEHGCDAVRVSSLTLVDLAGSERVAKTGAEGARMKEGTHINKSLMTLGTVINKLAEGVERNGGHIPYRDSKLTRILQPALGGNAKTAIICNVTPSLIHVEETRGTLQFAGRAKRIENCAQVNEIVTEAAVLKRQQREIEELRHKLQGNNSDIMEAEIAKMRNAMLAIELEKERLALELEERRAEEQRRKAETEMRIQEQQKKIDSLSHMVINSAVDDTQEKKSRKGNRRATWVPRIQPSVFTDLARDRPPLWEVPQGLLGSGLPLPHRSGRSRDLPPAFDRLDEESSGTFTGRPLRISEESSLSDVGEESPGRAASGRRSSADRMDGERASFGSVGTDSTVEQQLIDLQQKYKELEERTHKDAQAAQVQDDPQSANLAHLGAILEEDELPTGVADRRGRSLGGADGHASVRALKAQLKQLEMEKVFMQRELDDLTVQTKMRASITKEELETVYAELDEARRSLADSPTNLLPSEASRQMLVLQSQLSEALREKEAALEAAQRGEERAFKSARAQIQGLEACLAEALQEKEVALEAAKQGQADIARVQIQGLEERLAEALSQAQAASEELAKTGGKVAALEARCEDLSHELEDEKKRKEAAEECAGAMEGKAREQEAVITELREKLEAALEEKRSWEAQKETVSRMEKTSNRHDVEIEHELAVRSDQLAALEAALAEARQQLEIEKNRTAPPEGETAVSERESALEALLTEARAKILELEGDLEEAVRVLEEDDVRRAEQQSLLSRAEEELAQARREMAKKGDVSPEVQDLKDEVAALRRVEGELTQARRELAESKNATLEIQGLRDELAAAEAGRAQLDQEVQELRLVRSAKEEGNELVRKIEMLEDGKLELENRIESLTAELQEAAITAEGEATALAEKTGMFEADKSALEAELRILSDKVRELNEVRSELGHVRNLLTEEAQLRSAAEAAASEFQRQLDGLNEGVVKEASEERKGLLKTIAAMESERQKMEERIQSMAKEKDELQGSSEKASREAEAKLVNLEAKLRELEAEKEALHAAFNESQRLTEATGRKREEMTEALRADLQQVQNNLEAASRAKGELEERLAELVEEKKDLEAALRQEERSKLSEAGAQLQLLKSEISSLAETKANLESTISALEGRITGLESDYSHCQTALQASMEDSARLSTAVTQLEQTTRTLTENLAATESALRATDAAAEKQKAEFDAAWAEKEACLSKALQELAQLDAERMSVGWRVTELESQLETQRSVASEAFKELEATKQGQHKEVTALRTDLAGLRKELVHAKSEPTALTKQRDGLQKELEKLRTKMKDTEAKLKTAVQDKNQLQAEKSAQERDLKRLRGQANQIDQMASKRESMVVKSRDSLAVGLKSTRTELSSVHAALQNKSLELEKTAFELQMMQSSYKTLEGTVSELESTRDCLTKRLSEVEACLAGVSTERDQLAADAEVCSGELTRAREEAEKLAQELATLAAEHSALVEQLKGAEEGSRRAEELATELERVKAEQAQVMEQMTESHFQFEEDRAAWEAKEAQAAKEKAEWEEQLAGLTSLRAELEGRITELDHELAELKRQADDADSVKSSLLQQVAALEQRTEEERKEYVERKEQEVGRLREEVEALRVQCEELERQLVLADKSLEDSQRASAEAEAAAGEREERLQDMLQQSMTQTAEARQDLADKEEKLGQLQTAGLKLETALEYATGRVQLMEDRAAGAQEQVEKLREQLARVKASAAQRDRDMQEEAAAEREKVQRQWEDKIATIEKTFRAELEERFRTIEQLEGSLAAARDEIEALNAKANDLRARLEIEEERRKAAERNAEALPSSQDAADRTVQLEQEVSRLQTECQALRDDLEGMAAHNLPAEQAAELEDKLLEMTEQNRLLQNKLRKAEETVERSKSWKEEVRRQREADTEARAQVARHQADLETREAERMQLAAELAAANSQKAKAQSRQSLPAVLAAQASNEARFEVKARVLLEERRDFKEKCRNLEERLAELRRMVERNGGKVADFDKHAALKDLEYKVATGRTAIEKLKEQVAALEEQLKKAQAEKSQLNSKLHDATFKHCALLRSESLYQLNAASPSKAAPLDAFSVRPPLAERNKGLVMSLGDSSPPMGSVRKTSLSGHSAFPRGTPPSISRGSAQNDKENKG